LEERSICLDWGHNEILSQRCLVLSVARHKKFDILNLLSPDFGKIPAKLKIALPYYRRLEQGDISDLDLLLSKNQFFHVVGINRTRSLQKYFSPKLYEFQAFVLDLANKCLEFQSPCKEIFELIQKILLLQNSDSQHLISLSHLLLDLLLRHHGFPIETDSPATSKLNFLLTQLDTKVSVQALLELENFNVDC